MPTKIKTVKRRKSWPRWARWYCRQNPKLSKPSGRLSAYPPEMHESCRKYSFPHWGVGGDPATHVRGPLLSRDWTKTLRRIID